MDKTQILRSIDKLDRLGVEGVKHLLTVGRRDDSGAWTPGCGLTEYQADALLLAIVPVTTDNSVNTLQRLVRWHAVMAMPNDKLQTLYERLDRAGLIDAPGTPQKSPSNDGN